MQILSEGHQELADSSGNPTETVVSLSVPGAWSRLGRYDARDCSQGPNDPPALEDFRQQYAGDRTEYEAYVAGWNSVRNAD